MLYSTRYRKIDIDNQTCYLICHCEHPKVGGNLVVKLRLLRFTRNDTSYVYFSKDNEIMLLGYNTNISYRGNIYHVQTEDNGLKNPVITTFLYSRGAIIASKKTSYAHIVNAPDRKEKVRRLMKEQHRGMIKELLSGKYTGGDNPEETKKEDDNQ